MKPFDHILEGAGVDRRAVPLAVKHIIEELLDHIDTLERENAHLNQLLAQAQSKTEGIQGTPDIGS